MKKGVLVLLVVSLLANIGMLFFLMDEKEIDDSPPWSPFEFNSHITLQALVRDGYKFESMQCGIVRYEKTIRDTTVQFVVDIDCTDYESKYELPVLDEELDEVFFADTTTLTVEEEAFQDSLIQLERDSVIIENPYYPFDTESVENCFQEIVNRIYTIRLGEKIDSLLIVDMINNHGGRIVEGFSNWNEKDGGNILVYHAGSELFFTCWIYRSEYNVGFEDDWIFRMRDNIPKLDIKQIQESKERETKIHNYYHPL